ncbi:MAG: hypothetical protein E6593_08025 [Clostridium sp.]|nr:hypothetical protein [Clostridium sp.]
MKKMLRSSFSVMMMTALLCNFVVFAQTANQSLVSSPDYLVDTGAQSTISPYGATRPGTVYDVSKNGAYKFSGVCGNGGPVYTEYLIVGKYTYNVSVTNDSSSPGALTYRIYNFSSNDELVTSGTIAPGKTESFAVGGLSQTSKIHIKFTSSGSGLTSLSGSIG